jgi:hypothetical protein
MQLFIPSGGGATTLVHVPAAGAATAGNNSVIARKICRHSRPKWHCRTFLRSPDRLQQFIIFGYFIKD